MRYHRFKSFLVESDDGRVVPVVPHRLDQQFFRGNRTGQRFQAYGYYHPGHKVWFADRGATAIQPQEQTPLFPDRPLVYVDALEMSKITKDENSDTNYIVTRLRDEGWEVRTASLDAGDFLLSDRVLVELKHISSKSDDLHASLVDGRYFEQLNRLAAISEIPILLIYGDPCDSRARPENIDGAEAWALTSDDTPPNLRIVWRPDLLSVINLLVSIVKREQVEKKRSPSLKKAWKAETEEEQKLRVVASYPKIGVKLARKMLKAEGTIEKIASSSHRELTPLIGEHRARVVEKISKQPYKEEGVKK